MLIRETSFLFCGFDLFGNGEAETIRSYKNMEDLITDKYVIEKIKMAKKFCGTIYEIAIVSKEENKITIHCVIRLPWYEIYDRVENSYIGGLFK